MVTLVVQIILNGLSVGAGYGLMATSFALIYNTCRFFHFAHAAVYAAGAYIAYSMMSRGAATPVSIMVAGLLAAFIGSLMELSIYSPIRRRGGSPTVLLLASLGLMICLQNTLAILYGPGPRNLPPWVLTGPLNLGGARLAPAQVGLLLLAVLVWSLTALCLRFTRFGICLRAVADDKELARIIGVETRWLSVATFAIGSFVAAATSVVSAFDTGLRPTMGFNPLLMGVVGMIVGGTGNANAAFVGGVLSGLALQVGVWLTDSRWQEPMAFGILVVFLLMRPQGLWGHKGA